MERWKHERFGIQQLAPNELSYPILGAARGHRFMPTAVESRRDERESLEERRACFSAHS